MSVERATDLSQVSGKYVDITQQKALATRCVSVVCLFRYRVPLLWLLTSSGGCIVCLLALCCLFQLLCFGCVVLCVSVLADVLLVAAVVCLLWSVCPTGGCVASFSCSTDRCIAGRL